MSALDYTTEPSFDYPNIDASDVALVGATSLIEGRDVIEDYLACNTYPLLAS
jgi:hypothetical protein